MRVNHEAPIMRQGIFSLLLAASLFSSVTFAAQQSPDESFYKKAAEGGIAEVEQGKLAQSKGNRQDVKDFGAMMIKDHSAANEKLKAIASRKGIELPANSSVGQIATKGKLEVLTGDTFDKSYIKGMVSDHVEDIKEFEEESQNGKDPDARAFATQTLPTLKTHLKMIRSIAAAAGVQAD
jgi:putative membrane protein